MDIVIILLVLAGFVDFVLGWSMAAGYYADLVRRAFGLGDEVVIRGWLHTKAVKREIDELKAIQPAPPGIAKWNNTAWAGSAGDREEDEE